MRKIEEIIEEIEKMYTDFKDKEKKVGALKEALKHHYTVQTKESDENRLTILGMLLHFKSKPTYTWKKDELNEELENLGCLPAAKKIDRHVRKFLEWIDTDEEGQTILRPLSVFASEPEQYVRPFPKRRPKGIIASEKISLTSYEDQWKKSDIEQSVTKFKIEKLERDEMAHTYENLREELFLAMKEQDVNEIQCELGSFKIMEKEAEYDVNALIGHTFCKHLEYSIRPIDGKIEIIDHFSKLSLQTNEDNFQLDGHFFSFTENGLFIDDIHLTTITKDTLFSMESTLQDMDYPFVIATADMTIDSDLLIQQLPFSAEKIERLIDKGLLHPNTLKTYRYVASEKDLSYHFEVVEEVTHHTRVEQFIDRHLRRSQTLRYMQENAKDVLNAL